MKFLGRDVLQNTTLKRKQIPLPELDGIILIRELTGKEAIPVSQGAMQISQAREKGELDVTQAQQWYALTVCLGWINEDGSHVFDPEKDVDALLSSLPNDLISVIASEIRQLSGLEKKADGNQTAVEKAKKN